MPPTDGHALPDYDNLIPGIALWLAKSRGIRVFAHGGRSGAFGPPGALPTIGKLIGN